MCIIVSIPLDNFHIFPFFVLYWTYTFYWTLDMNDIISNLYRFPLVRCKCLLSYEPISNTHQYLSTLGTSLTFLF
jgi:hypothetical protein